MRKATREDYFNWLRAYLLQGGNFTKHIGDGNSKISFRFLIKKDLNSQIKK